MKLEFSKYQGTGNDFVLIDNRTNIFTTDNNHLIEQLCDRRFGIGGDGLMLLENAQGYDFRMRYYNSDGKEGSMELGDDFYFLDTGSPHFVQFINNHENFDTFTEGKKIRYNNRFAEEGTNVNFVSLQEQDITVSTYERGVEDETYSCGTGVVASAISSSFKTNRNQFKIKTKGGNLKVHFNKISNKRIEDIWLIGPATHVFNGTLMI